MDRHILHVDMDAFFAAIEMRENPALKGKPVVIGSPPDKRGVVSTASYEARQFGIHSAMPSRTAGKLCPQAIFLPVNGALYTQVSHQVMDILHRFTPLVEQVSVDEAFLDVTGAMGPWSDPVVLANELKQSITDDLQLTASAGLAGNKFLAKLASDMDKPDGLTVVPRDPDEIVRFLAPLPVGRIWGVGKAARERLKRFGITTVAELQEQDEETLRRWFGDAFGSHLWHLARGLDERPVVTDRDAKSISNEHTFGIDCDDIQVVRQRLIELTENVGRRLRRSEKYAGTGQIKLRFSDFKTLTRQQGFAAPTRTDHDLLACALELLERETVRRPVRLIGFGVSNLSDAPGQQLLFEAPSHRHQALDQAVDTVREHFGKGALRRGDWRMGDKDSP
jgi:DNA polymerase-4